MKIVDYLDFGSAESALHSIAEAYRRRDIEAAVQCKDFQTESWLMLKRMGHGHEANPKFVADAASLLEASFREHTLKSWPDFAGVESHVESLKPYLGMTYIALEVGAYPSGQMFSQKMFMSKSDSGWRVLNPVPAMSNRQRSWWKFWG